MTIKITGKNLDLGDSLRSHILEKIDLVVAKYTSGPLSGQFSVEKYNDGFTAHCAIHLTSGLDMQATGQGQDAYSGVDAAINKLEKRLRRYKQRLKDHAHNVVNTAAPSQDGGTDYIIDASEPVEDAGDENVRAAAPAIIAETRARIRAMSVGDAAMQLDLAEEVFIVFRNAAHGRLNVVYRRSDGNIGWLDPAVTAPEYAL